MWPASRVFAHRNASAILSALGYHLRPLLPRASEKQLATQPEAEWQLRLHANLLYKIFPLGQLPVQQDHLIRVRLELISEARTRISLKTMAPKDTRPDIYSRLP